MLLIAVTDMARDNTTRGGGYLA